MEKVRIEIENMRVFARHGVYAHERENGNDFEVSAMLEVAATEAVASDRLDATVNYAEVCDVILQVMSEPSDLLEHVCGRLRERLTACFPSIEGGRVRVAKLNPPIENVKLNSVAVSLSW